MSYDSDKYARESRQRRKYRLTESQLDKQGNINKLIRDGFNRSDVSKALYAMGLTDPVERREVYKKLHRGGED